MHRQTDAYAVSASAAGAMTVELLESTTAVTMGGSLLFPHPRDSSQATDRSVTTVNDGAARHAERTFERSYSSNVTARTHYVLTIANDSARVRSGSWVAEGSAPHGAILRSLFEGAVAALPDSLPVPVNIWTVKTDSTGIRVESIRVAFGKRAVIDVPMADDGARCTKDTRTHKMKMDVVTAIVSARRGNVEYFVLATRPHIDVEPTVHCLSLRTTR